MKAHRETKTQHPDSGKLKICILIPLRHAPNLPIYPGEEILGYLTEFGHEIACIVSIEEERWLDLSLPQDVKVYTVSSHSYFRGDSILSRTLNRIPHLFKKMRFILRVVRREKYDLILVRQDVFNGLLAAYIKRRHKIPFVFNCANPLEQLWEISRAEGRKPKFIWYLYARFHELAGSYLLRKTNLVLVISKWLKERLIEQGVPESRVLTFPAGVDIEAFSAGSGGKIREEYSLASSKVILYIGVLSRARHLGLLIRAFSRAKAEIANAKLLIVGTGNAEVYLKNLAAELGVEGDVIFTGQVPRAEVPGFIAGADIGISPIEPLPCYKLSSPIKILEYMAMTKPVIANEEIPEHRDVLEQSGAGILAPFTPEAFADAMVELLGNPDQAVEMGRRGREWVLKNRSYEVLARQIEERCLELFI